MPCSPGSTITSSPVGGSGDQIPVDPSSSATTVAQGSLKPTAAKP